MCFYKVILMPILMFVWIIFSDKNQYPEMDDHCLADSAIPRNNMDNKRTNKSGKSPLNICKETALKLVNGRSMHDIFGNFTFHL